MDFTAPLIPGRLVARYKRFFADVALDDGTAVTAHCPNPGAMLGLNAPGLPVWLSRSDDPKRKLAHTLELVEADGGLVGINTMHPNRLVAEALAAGAIPEVGGYESIRREVRYGTGSRVDFLLESAVRPPCWLEVKNVQSQLRRELRADHKLWLEVKNCHLSRTTGLAEFPDCVAARSTKHLIELEAMVREGDRAAVLFVVQRTDCDRFSPAADCDPTFAEALERVVGNGVELYVYACDIRLEGVRLARRIACPWT
jgi:sugar fermentation stimulation protein A